MGREATCHCRVGAQAATAKALLESSALILRGAVKRHYPLAAIAQISVQGAELHFRAGDEAVVLDLGTDRAAAWARQLVKPPPSLAAKLGVGPDRPVYVLGTVHDPVLSAALQGAVAETAGRARQWLAVLLAPADLQALLQALQATAAPTIWAVYRKGPAADPGDGQVRQALRAAGYRDSKTSAVSTQLTATRYSTGHPAA